MTGDRRHAMLERLRRAYDTGAAARDQHPKSAWKIAERSAFGDRLARRGARSLLEIGAGTGQDSRYFQEQGFDVVATDLTPAMVAACRAKGLDARLMDVLAMDFPVASFDAVYTMNCLLHVPNADLPAALTAIGDVLRPGGLFFLGVYGGDGSEGVADWDDHDPPRFFSMRTDEQIRRYATDVFDLVDFHALDVDGGFRFQSLTLRRPAQAP
ncbi:MULTISPECIES: class I SAM-dependent methyltransferase [unclassified Solwaraspora]|uniref:class I SAM-dependent methyltransferase n=1 Tax=unclassified Solwaraspora TaxID=2627926 RepID=UPI00259B892E|nr:class I SAM-dependent methyltransferase [Solwaraspora sp. WMMA2056]WJK41957.1 class I SAM-dependent methyltransferase [Solwaraspora sp. WMMA2056]